MQRVGVIGLGVMGLPIARNLMERGFDVIGYRRSGSPELAEAGGTVAVSAAEVAASADVLVSIVPDADAVSNVVCGPHGTLTTMRPGTVHLEMSTVDIGRKQAVRDAVAEAGGELLDCPISGGPPLVVARRATTFASGDQAAVEKAGPVLDAIAGPWVYTGAFGTGARMKYIANLLLAVHTVAAAEAMELARRGGLDLDLVQRTLDDSIGSSAIWRTRGPVMRARAWSPAPGPITTLQPILEQIEDYAAGADLPMPVFSSAKAVFDKAVAEGWGALDIACVLDQIAGVSALDPGPDRGPAPGPDRGPAPGPDRGPNPGPDRGPSQGEPS